MKTADDVQRDALRAEIEACRPLLSEQGRALLDRIHASAPWGTLEQAPLRSMVEAYNLVRRSIEAH